MTPDRESTKRESRIRVGDDIRDLPTDVHTRLAEETTAHRYRSQWDCAIRALDLGLSVMRIQRDRLGEILNAREQS
jgi:hypothetical protein